MPCESPDVLITIHIWKDDIIKYRVKEEEEEEDICHGKFKRGEQRAFLSA